MVKVLVCFFAASIIATVISAASVFFSTVWGLSPIFIMLGIILACIITLFLIGAD